VPSRIQRKRTLGWRMPEGALYVGRPTRWANPFKVERTDAASRHYGEWFVGDGMGVMFWATREEAAGCAVRAYRSELVRGVLPVSTADAHRHLRGRDLACWCPLDQPCHADLLLAVANASDGHFCERHWSWRCSVGQGECQSEALRELANS